MVKWYEHFVPAGGVLIATMLIAWATEVLSFFLSRGLAFAVLALLQVLPEFAVEAVITRDAALNPENLRYVTANFTGANRLIVGLFIPMVFFMGWHRARQKKRPFKALELPVDSSIEIVALVLATLYSFVIIVRGTVGLVDAGILIGLYAAYLALVYKLPPQEEHDEELPLVPRKIRQTSPRTQKMIVALFFLVGGFLLFRSVHPFYENTLELGATLGISSYFLLQWMAPFLSEFPEFITILYWGRTGRATVGLTNAVSSKVNQWTLLIAMIPIVYVFSTWQAGATRLEIQFSESQRLEILLTAAQGLFAAAALLNLRFYFWEAFALLTLWAIQLLDPLIDPLIHARYTLPYLFTPEADPVTGELIPHYVREWTTWAYLCLTVGLLVASKDRFAAIHGFKTVVRDHLGWFGGTKKAMPANGHLKAK